MANSKEHTEWLRGLLVEVVQAKFLPPRRYAMPAVRFCPTCGSPEPQPKTCARCNRRDILTHLFRHKQT